MLNRYPGDLFADFDELHRRFEQLFGGQTPPSRSLRSVARGAFPALNIGTTPETVEVFAFLPGVDASSIDVSVDKGVLTLSGQRPAAPEPSRDGEVGKARTVYAQERPTGAFRRTVSLPEDADPSRVEASYRNGVLGVRIQKREASRPRRIQVN
jgi:HSP20 family protein